MGLSSIDKLLKVGKKGEPRIQPAEMNENIGRISTGSINIDYMLGGGFAQGRVNEIFGPYSGGKTTVALHVVKWVQEYLGLGAIYLDTENSLDDNYAQVIGVDYNPEKFRKYDIITCEEVERILRIHLNRAEESNLGVVVIDSISAVIPAKLLGEESSTEAIAERARFWAKLAPYVNKLCKKHNVTLLNISQIRAKINTNKFTPWYSSENITGGKAWEFYKTISLRLENAKDDSSKVISDLTGEDFWQPCGVEISAKSLKNKVYKPHQQCRAYIKYGEGFDNLKDAISIFAFKGMLNHEKGSSFYKFIDPETDKEVKIKGEESIYNELLTRPDLCNKWVKDLGIDFTYF